MCTPKIISSFAPKIRIIIIKTNVTFLLVNQYHVLLVHCEFQCAVCTQQTDCQLYVHNNIITVHRNLVYLFRKLFCTRWYIIIIDMSSCTAIISNNVRVNRVFYDDKSLS